MVPSGDANRKLSSEERGEIVRLYTTRRDDGTWLGASTIARMFGVAHPTVYRVLRQEGVRRRSAKEAHAHGKRCKPIINLPPAGSKPLPCKCGCGELPAWNRRKNRWNLYVDGHYRRPARYKSRKWLLAEYVEKRRPVAHLAADCGVNPSSVNRYLERFGIPPRQRAASTVPRKPGWGRGRSMPGPLNPSWKGGVTPERQRLYRSAEWKALVRGVLARDGYHCVRCGAPKREKGSLHTHHLRPWSEATEVRMDPDNLVTLCRSCHAWVHSRANVERELLA